MIDSAINIINAIADVPVVGDIALRLAAKAVAAVAWFAAAGPEGILALFWDGRDTTQLVVVAGMMVFLLVMAAMMVVSGLSPAPGVADAAGRAARGTGAALGGFFGSGAPQAPPLGEARAAPSLETPPTAHPDAPKTPSRKAPDRGKPGTPPPAAEPGAASGTAGKGGDAAGRAAELAAIEAEMMTLKELHAREHITTDEYVSESRALYERAKALD